MRVLLSMPVLVTLRTDVTLTLVASGPICQPRRRRSRPFQSLSSPYPVRLWTGQSSEYGGESRWVGVRWLWLGAGRPEGFHEADVSAVDECRGLSIPWHPSKPQPWLWIWIQVPRCMKLFYDWIPTSWYTCGKNV